MFDWDAYGALHLVLLHLPIGLFIGILALELGLSRDKYPEAHDVGIGVLLPLCLLSTILTVRFGYALGQVDYDWDAIANHRNAGYVFLGSLTVATLAFWWTRWRPNWFNGFVYALSMAASLVSLVLTGHFGGVITHGENVLDATIPDFIKPTPIPTVPDVIVPDVEPANPYTDEAWVILDQHCVECHGINKRKGGYRLDVPRLARAGGDSHKHGIVPGEPDASELIIRVMLPRESEDAMPPSKKLGLSPTQVDVLRAWIEAGSQFPGEENKQEEKLDPETVKSLEALRDLGATADFTPWGDGTVLVNIGQMDKPDWQLCHTKLLPLKSKLVWLNAGNQEWPPELYDQLEDFPQLQRLHLEHTNVTDADLVKVTALKALTYLNLTSTNVSLDGLKTVLTLPKLSELYVHAIDIKPTDLKKLRQDNLSVEIAGIAKENLKVEEEKK